MEAQLGGELNLFLDAMQEKSPTSIRLNPNKHTGLFQEEGVIPWCPSGRFLMKRPQFVFDPLYHAGCYYSQESSSMLFANLIDFQQDIRILDLCAAPGGKSSLLLSNMTADSVLISNEMIGKRNFILQENLIKWGNSNVIVSQNKAEDFRHLKSFFDVILIDAPCSGEGMFRKDDEAVEQWSESLVESCSHIQSELLRQAIPLLKSSGILIYSTCTFEPSENEHNLIKAIESFPDDFEPVRYPDATQTGLTEIEYIANETVHYGYYCYPHKLPGEGQFFSAFRKSDIQSSGQKNENRGKINQVSSQIQSAVDQTFDSHGLSLFEFKNEIHASLPSLIQTLPFLKELTLRKTGVRLGSAVRGQLIFSHESAMSFDLSYMGEKVELNLSEALDYMQRQTMSPQKDMASGYFQYTYQGIPIGWAKNVGNRVNAQYPQEWRIRKQRPLI